METLTIKEVAAKLGVSESTVLRVIKDGDLKAIRIRGCWRIPATELENYWRFITGEVVQG